MSARVIGTRSSVASFPARLLPASRYFTVNGEAFAFHPVEPPRLQPISKYRLRGVQ